MRAQFRCIWLGVVFLAVFAAATSCKKPKEVVPEKAAEPWPIAAVLEWGFWVDDNGPSIVLYSDRRVIIKRPPPNETSSAGHSYWTKVLSPEEFVRVEEAASLAMRTSCLTDGYDSMAFDRLYDFGAVTCLYFGIPEKGITVNIEGLPLLRWQKEMPEEITKRIEGGFLPLALNQYCSLLPSLVKGDFEPWKPTALIIELYFEPAQQVTGTRWPEDLPKPEVPPTVSINTRIYLKMDVNRLGQVQKVFNGKLPGESVGIEIDGKQYAAEYRFYFPGEENWRDAFPRFVTEKFDGFEIPVSRSEYSSPSKPKDAFVR